MRILVVDDEKVIVKGICFNLRSDGYEVDAHSSPRPAICSYRASNIVLVNHGQ